MKRTIKARRGAERECKTWQAEAALRMLRNNLDPENAERPEDLVVYGGRGRAARSWEALEAIERSLINLEEDETLLVQSGKPVAVFRSHPDAPRVLLANSNLVGQWATWEHFDELDAQGLMMYGQMTAGSWIYIGTQGILQGTYETLAEAARQHFGTDGSLAGKLFLTAGLGGMGGAQPLATTMLGGVCLAIEIDQSRIERRIEHRYLDRWTADVDEAIKWVMDAKLTETPLSVGLLGNAAELLPLLAERQLEAELVSDQTSAHDPLVGYIPAGMSLAEAEALRASDKPAYLEAVGDPATGLPMGDTKLNLEASIAGETHEYTDMYPGMAKTARDEGFDEIADWFETLAKAERSHANRFQKALDNLDG